MIDSVSVTQEIREEIWSNIQKYDVVSLLCMSFRQKKRSVQSAQSTGTMLDSMQPMMISSLVLQSRQLNGRIKMVS